MQTDRENFHYRLDQRSIANHHNSHRTSSYFKRKPSFRCHLQSLFQVLFLFIRRSQSFREWDCYIYQVISHMLPYFPANPCQAPLHFNTPCHCVNEPPSLFFASHSLPTRNIMGRSYSIDVNILKAAQIISDRNFHSMKISSHPLYLKRSEGISVLGSQARLTTRPPACRLIPSCGTVECVDDQLPSNPSCDRCTMTHLHPVSSTTIQWRRDGLCWSRA